MTRAVYFTLAVVTAIGCSQTKSSPRTSGIGGGLRLEVVGNSGPAVAVLLPGQSLTDAAIRVLVPEHVTAVRQGDSVAEHLYFPSSDSGDRSVTWRRLPAGVEYERDLPRGVHFIARATLEEDGVRFHYEFVNHSPTAYEMIYAVTDPRLTGQFHDERLERTYVRQDGGFDLLASETPARLTMGRDRWLPARYLASVTWPVPPRLVDRRPDGITYYTRSRRVDAPFLATVSTDGTWLVASFTRQVGNVWSNPELTCQHVDPQRSLPPNGRAVAEIKILVMRGTVADAFARSQQQRSSLH